MDTAKKAILEKQSFAWPLPSDASTYTGYWMADELLQDSYAKQLATTSYELKNEVKEQIRSLNSMEKQYKAACLIAQNKTTKFFYDCEVDGLLKTAIDKDLVPFVASITPFYAINTNVVISELYSTVRYDTLPHVHASTLQKLPLFFSAKSLKMANWLGGLDADHSLRAGTDRRTVVHHLCTHTPDESEHADTTQEIVKLLSLHKKLLSYFLFIKKKAWI